MKAKVPSIFRELFKPYRYKVFRGGRGGGKSRTIVSALVAIARTKRVRVLCCREIQRSIKDSVKRVIDDEIARHGLEKEFTSTQTEVRHNTTGSLFIFAGLRADPDGIKSTEGIDIAWVEEAYTVSQASLDILIPTIRQENSEIWFSYNPRFDDDPVQKLFDIENPPPRAYIKDVQYWDNPWFPDVLREEMEYCKVKDFDKYLHVWEGKTVQQSDEQVMHGCWKIEEVPTPPSDAILKYGVDWGFSVDPLAVIRSWIEGRTLYIDYEAGGVGVKTVDIPANIKEVPGADKWPITADSQRPDTIDYIKDQGFHITGAKKGKGSIEDGIEYIKSFNVIIDPRCTQTIDEFIHYKFKKDRHTDKILPVIVDANNHFIDALRYSHEGAYGKFNKGLGWQ
ncbi:MAG: PBSX family phage terminase large subunit [Pseudomonadota bacterium]